jgi:2-succinyl-5-enolpyruvyl-6-hydroxy-3-cyclohexene-1-carboxylate synthase
MPVRDVEWYGVPPRGVSVFSNRGANGIDGVLSTAVGMAVSDRAPTVALLGDLAFAYDAGALLWAPSRDVCLTVVVVDNDGGGIFSFLPQASAYDSSTFERYWGTPHGIDLSSLAAAYGADVVRVDGRGELESLVGDAAKPGVRVGIVQCARAGNVAAHERLNTAVANAVLGPDERR